MDGGMTDAQQAYDMFKQFIEARLKTPWVALWFLAHAEADDHWMGPRRCIERMGGMAADW